MNDEADRDVREPLRGLSWTTIALIGGLVLLVLIVAYFASRGNSNQDKLTKPQAANAADLSRCRGRVTGLSRQGDRREKRRL